MMSRETVAVYCENHTEHTNTLCGQNEEFLNVNTGDTCGYHCALKNSHRDFEMWADGQGKLGKLSKVNTS
jgi:hypothetical protein